MGHKVFEAPKVINFPKIPNPPKTPINSHPLPIFSLFPLKMARPRGRAGRGYRGLVVGEEGGIRDGL